MILEVIEHYIEKEEKLKHNVLAVQKLQGDHSDENQAAVVADVLMNYEIEYKLNFFVEDNAKSNDTLCEKLSQCKLLISLMLKFTNCYLELEFHRSFV